MALRICKVQHEYPFGHLRKIGEQFDVGHQDVEVMLLMGLIEPENIEPEASAEYFTRDMSARQKRPYNRKAA